MTTETGLQAVDVRNVTPAEIAHYREHGWVKLEQLINPSVIAEILASARDKMGEDGSRQEGPGAFSYFNARGGDGLADPRVRPILEQLAGASAALQARKPGTGVRYFIDYFGVKLPSGTAEGHGKSDWHQDFSAQVSDRSGGTTFWIPLTDMVPEMGTMAFLSGSHRQGVMGDYRTYGDGDLLDTYPELTDSCTSSGQMHYRVGDVTVHSDLCVHFAGPNISDQPRWTYIVVLNPADACWTGAPPISFDAQGLTSLQPLEDAGHPRLA